MEIGSKVRIKKSSRYYGKNSNNNPAKVEGTVTQIGDPSGDHPIRVLWDTSMSNSYYDSDLEVTSIPSYEIF